jgi:hypothetical protein
LSVRRFLAIVLLALLPLQFSWAAVASYCEHETQGQHAEHFGHHDHDHAHQANASSDAGPAADLTADASPTPDETAQCGRRQGARRHGPGLRSLPRHLQRSMPDIALGSATAPLSTCAVPAP